jgi:phosphatidylglycerophosphatase C
MNLALFDFDKTLTDRDSFRDFLRYHVGCLAYWSKIFTLLPTLLAYYRGRLDAGRLKAQFLWRFFADISSRDFTALATAYARQRLPQLLRSQALERLHWHRQRRDRVLIVSASPENWIKAWAEPQGIEVLATRLDMTTGRFSGRLDGENCKGEEKVTRIKAHLDISAYETIYAYGDSAGDREMLALADKKYYRRFSDAGRE